MVSSEWRWHLPPCSWAVEPLTLTRKQFVLAVDIIVRVVGQPSSSSLSAVVVMVVIVGGRAVVLADHYRCRCHAVVVLAGHRRHCRRHVGGGQREWDSC